MSKKTKLEEETMTLPKDRKSIWELSYRHAMEDPRITGDADRARTLDVKQITGTDFMSVGIRLPPSGVVWGRTGEFLAETTKSQLSHFCIYKRRPWSGPNKHFAALPWNSIARLH